MFIFIVPSRGGAITAGYQQNELQERLFLFFSFLIFYMINIYIVLTMHKSE